MLSVENLAYHYKGGSAVLKDVTFNVNAGEFLAILGNNGVGKSTMLKCFNKILTPDDGKIILDDENLLQMNARQVAQRVAFVAQSVPSIQITVHDMVMLGRRPYMKWGFTEDDRWRSSRSSCCSMSRRAAWIFKISIRFYRSFGIFAMNSI